jgi:hypothetical protein
MKPSSTVLAPGMEILFSSVELNWISYCQSNLKKETDLLCLLRGAGLVPLLWSNPNLADENPLERYPLLQSVIGDLKLLDNPDEIVCLSFLVSNSVLLDLLTNPKKLIHFLLKYNPKKLSSVESSKLPKKFASLYTRALLVGT